MVRSSTRLSLGKNWGSEMTKPMQCLAAAMVLYLSGAASSALAQETVTVTTLEWPPYTSPELPFGGAVTEIVTQAFANAGLEADIVTLPWQRAIVMAREEHHIAGYFPGYHCRHMDGFVPSDPIGFGPLGLVENAEAPISWEAIDELGEKQYVIGTVLGYANTDEFDEKAGTGWIKVVPAADDITNLRKLMRQRIDAAVIDRLVLSFLLATEPSLAEGRELLVFDERPLEEKTLFLCFNDDEEGRALRDTFNAGLSTIDVNDTIDRYFREKF